MSEVTTATPAPSAAASVTTGQAATTTAAPAAAAATTSTDWTSGLNEDLRGYVQNKGFKDPAAAIDSYRNLEKLMGVPKERLLKLPEKEDDPAWSEVHARLGRPASPDEYKIDGDNKDFAKWAKETFHGLGLNKKQAEALFGKYNEFAQGHATKQMETQVQQAQASETSLRKEWGAAYDQNVMTAKKAAMTFGLTKEVIDKLESAMGYADVMKFMSTIGSKVGEDSFVASTSSNRGFGVMTPEQAKNRIAGLKQDREFISKLSQGNAEARAEWDRLNQWAVST